VPNRVHKNAVIFTWHCCQYTGVPQYVYQKSGGLLAGLIFYIHKGQNSNQQGTDDSIW